MSALEKMLTTMPSDGAPQRPGPNKLLQAMEDYDHLVDEAAHLREELSKYTDIANKMTADNEMLRNQLRVQGEFFTRQISAVTAHRDRLKDLSTALITRFKMIHESFNIAEKEALAEQISANERAAPLEQEDQAALDRLQLSKKPGDGTWREQLDSTK
jgi:hypothetical protein